MRLQKSGLIRRSETWNENLKGKLLKVKLNLHYPGYT